MNRRTLLKILCGFLASATASIVAIPGISFVLAPLRRKQSATVTQRVARLSDLPIGKPVQFPIVGNHRDAWTVHDREVLGRVWVIRRDEGSAAGPESMEVTAFSTLCPHLGCALQHDAKGNQFVCPCHRAAFQLDGSRAANTDPARKNHAPRNMDSLECHVVQDGTTGESWVEVTFERFEQGLTQKVRKA
jgi:Rieske Fe-S protein